MPGPFRKQRTAVFYDKEIFKYPPAYSPPTKNIVIDSTTVPKDPSSGRHVLEAGQIMCKVAASAGANQVTLLTVAATGGTFRLAVNGGWTAPIAVSGITAATIQSALRALSNVTATGVTVTGGASPFTLTFAAPLANQPVDVSVDQSAATGGNVSIANTTLGHFVSDATKVRPAQASGEVASDIVGLLTHTIEFFYPVETNITDADAAIYFPGSGVQTFDITQLPGYSGNSAAIATALTPPLRFE